MNSTVSHEFLEQARRHAQSDEELLSFLRHEGISKGQSVVIYSDIREVNLSEAKVAVHLSETWADVRPADERLHEDLMNLHQLSSEPLMRAHPRRPRRNS